MMISNLEEGGNYMKFILTIISSFGNYALHRKKDSQLAACKKASDIL